MGDEAAAALAAAEQGGDAVKTVSAEEHAAVVAENETLKTKLAAAEKGGKAKVERKPASKKARAITVMAEGKALPTAEMGPRLAGGGLELVFSDGKKEITGIDPFVINGNAWQHFGSGWLLTEPVLIDGPDKGEAPFELAGVGLVDAESGDQLAYCAFPEPITVKANTQTELRRSIIF